MAREKKEQPEEQEIGAPEWMVTFSDCMTLLLTFFVLLLSFSTFERKTFEQVKTSLNNSLSSISTMRTRPKESIVEQQIINELEKGSEVITQDRKMMGNLQESTVNFRDFKVFLMKSENLFWANGVALTSGGKELLSKIAEFISKVPGKIVISENGPTEPALQRSLAIFDYLAKNGVSSERLSISSKSMAYSDSKATDRFTEIVLLDRNIFK